MERQNHVPIHQIKVVVYNNIAVKISIIIMYLSFTSMIHVRVSILIHSMTVIYIIHSLAGKLVPINIYILDIVLVIYSSNPFVRSLYTNLGILQTCFAAIALFLL